VSENGFPMLIGLNAFHGNSAAAALVAGRFRGGTEEARFTRAKHCPGLPLILNTSFNENWPIVNPPEEALACFPRAQMDRIVLGNRVVRRKT